jgi:hypothetical protein
VHCAFLYLPGLFKMTPAAIPSEIPYLRPDPELVEHWRQRVPADPAILKVRLVRRDREDSPFYPTMRLLRQRRLGDWGGAISRMAAVLKSLSENRIARR